MNQWVALFRGINVGGRHILPMKELAALLAGLGCEDVATYIQSGNVAFRHSDSGSTKLAGEISAQVNKKFGFSPGVFLMSADELEHCVSQNPFTEATKYPQTLHLSFLAEKAVNADIESMQVLCSASEEFELTDKVFYLYAPAGIARSKLAAKTEKLLGVTTTTRNWRTVNKVLELARKKQEPARAGS